jgi:lipopolysaccharide transport system permease protein
MALSKIGFKDFLCLNKKFLIYNLITRNLKLRYRKSYVGILWTMLIPAANAIVYNVVFEYIMKVQVPNYLLFLLSGLLPWAFFSNSLINGMESLVGNQSVLNKVPIPAYSFTLAETLTAFTNFLLALPVMGVMLFIFDVPFNIYQCFIPVAILLLLLQAYGLSLILAYVFVYFRDLRHLLSIILQIWFYLTPILYSAKMIPAKLEFVNWINPVAPIFHLFHRALGSEGVANDSLYIIPFVWTAVILIVSLLVVRKFNQEVVESL